MLADYQTLAQQKGDGAQQLYTALSTNLHLRTSPHTRPLPAAAYTQLSAWQSERLCQTHADLLESPTYGPAARYFFSDLYGPKDFTQRDDDLIRIFPHMLKLLPDQVLSIVARAISLDNLTKRLDHTLLERLMANQTFSADMSLDDYALAYQQCNNQAERLQQIDLIQQIGRDLDIYVHKTFIYLTLKLAKGPAHLAGLGELQDFLERGFSAFRNMQSADYFLTTIGEREKHILANIYAQKPHPFTLQQAI